MIFSKEDFKQFISLCGFIKGYCDDLHIKNAKIHQKSNNSLFVIDADLSSIFNADIDELRLSNLQKTNNMLSVFSDAEEVTLTKDEKSYYLSDKSSTLEIRIPQDSILTNKYDEQLMTSYNPESYFLTYKLDDYILKKIKKISDVVNTQNIEFNISSDNISALLTDTAKNITMTVFTLPYGGSVVITEPYSLKLNNACFLNIPTKTDPMLSIFYDENTNIAITLVSIKFSDVINIDIYQRTRIR